MDLSWIALQAEGVFVVSVLILFAFLPPIFFAMWIRNTERYGREPWWAIARAFLWGAVFAVIIGATLSLVLVFLIENVTPVYEILARRGFDPGTIVLALVVAPFTEELAKAFGVWRTSGTIREPEDGLVYGATCGLGFSATENLLYGVWALTTAGLEAFLVLIAVRSVSSSLLHASATSLSGYGIARRKLWGPRFSVLPWYLGAVAIHAGFNGLASLGVLYMASYGEGLGALFVLASAVIFALIAISLVRGKILEHEGREDWIR